MQQLLVPFEGRNEMRSSRSTILRLRLVSRKRRRCRLVYSRSAEPISPSDAEAAGPRGESRDRTVRSPSPIRIMTMFQGLRPCFPRDAGLGE